MVVIYMGIHSEDSLEYGGDRRPETWREWCTGLLWEHVIIVQQLLYPVEETIDVVWGGQLLWLLYLDSIGPQVLVLQIGEGAVLPWCRCSLRLCESHIWYSLHLLRYRPFRVVGRSSEHH